MAIFCWRGPFTWLRTHRKSRTLLILLTLFVLLNFFAYMHARAMLNYGSYHGQSPEPARLTFLRKIKAVVAGVSSPRPETTAIMSTAEFPVDVVTLQTTDGMQLEGWYSPCDAAKGTVLCFHGYASSREAILPQAKFFRQLGYNVLLIDFRGSGGSQGHRTTIGCDESHDVAAAVGYVKSRGAATPLILYGQSMGAAALLRAIAKNGITPDAVIIESVFDRMLTTVQNRFHLIGLPSFPGANLMVFWGGVHIGHWAFSHNPAEYAPHCTCPALVLHGELDVHAKLIEGQSVYEQLAGPKKMVVFPGVPHSSLIIAKRELWANSVQEFLNTAVPSIPKAD